MIAVIGGIALETQRLRVRLTCLALLVLMVVPFAYTLSRASFLAVPFVLAVLGVFSSQRRTLVAAVVLLLAVSPLVGLDRKSTRLNSSHGYISYAVFCLKKKK